MKHLIVFENWSLNEEEVKIPLNAQQMAEFEKIAAQGKQLDRNGNGKMNEKALEAANSFATTNRNTMFQNGDWTKPNGLCKDNKDSVNKITVIIDKIQKDLSGIGSPIGGLSDKILGEIKDLTLITDSNKELERYNKILNVCMLFNGYSQKTKKYLTPEIAEDIKADFGERHNSWQDTAESIFGSIGI
jgi:hypothetical protein